MWAYSISSLELNLIENIEFYDKIVPSLFLLISSFILIYFMVRTLKEKVTLEEESTFEEEEDELEYEIPLWKLHEFYLQNDCDEEEELIDPLHSKFYFNVSSDDEEFDEYLECEFLNLKREANKETSNKDLATVLTQIARKEYYYLLKESTLNRM